MCSSSSGGTRSMVTFGAGWHGNNDGVVIAKVQLVRGRHLESSSLVSVLMSAFKCD